MISLVECEPSFRLWISAEPHPKFPIGLLQMSIKITNEAPAGVRAGLKASYNWINQDLLDVVSQPQWRVMLYALCFMHTIVQERRKFGPLGFNVPYEFNQSDLSACVQFMQNHLNDMETKKRPVDWIVINYMVCDVQYGGRITDDWDRRLFNTYGKAWLTQQCLDQARYLVITPRHGSRSSASTRWSEGQGLTLTLTLTLTPIIPNPNPYPYP